MSRWWINNIMHRFQMIFICHNLLTRNSRFCDYLSTTHRWFNTSFPNSDSLFHLYQLSSCFFFFNRWSHSKYLFSISTNKSFRKQKQQTRCYCIYEWLNVICIWVAFEWRERKQQKQQQPSRCRCQKAERLKMCRV